MQPASEVVGDLGLCAVLRRLGAEIFNVGPWERVGFLGRRLGSRVVGVIRRNVF